MESDETLTNGNSNEFDLSIREAELKKIVIHESIDQEAEARILVLYTGGTIGMKSNNQGVYEPKANFLVGELKHLPMFHDVEYAEKYLTSDDADYLAMPFYNHPDPDVNRYSKGKRILYKIIEYDPLLDSSNMNMTDWFRIATDIHSHYEQFDGFIVLHGTDTMAYTASALSFICENLGKPIILTGSQIPIFEIRSDGRDNFLSSLIFAGHYCIPEVMVSFDNKILRGNRTSKKDSSSFDAFWSPNLPPLANLEIKVTVDWDAIYRSGSCEKFSVATTFCRNVGVLRLFPGITAQTVRAFMSTPMQGVVLQTYGAGNAPSNRPDLLQSFKEATNMGVIIVNITQCNRGFVDTSYETGKALSDVGVIGGGDMTPEAALTKLSYILGKETYTNEKKRAMMSRNLRGELKVVVKEDMSIMDFELIEGVAKTLCLSSKEEVVKLKDALYPNLMCTSAKTGDILALEKLRGTGGNFSSANQDGRTALHVACREGHLEVVQYLLQHGASVHAKDLDKKTPLMDAVQNKHFSIISILVQTGAIITLQPVILAMELCRASSQEDVDTLKAWKIAGADLNESDYDNRTALHVAVSLGHVETVKFLLDNGASWMLNDAFGKTAEEHAELLGREEILKLISKAKENHTQGT
ncbi:L-asparaginase-like isoform X1 [Mytilus edulis]|uniref:L-asparaginase-like isoform X1 n=1 Tax=Mytilus edulis TaxID=6550 RepID=UPI0039EDEC50